MRVLCFAARWLRVMVSVLPPGRNAVLGADFLTPESVPAGGTRDQPLVALEVIKALIIKLEHLAAGWS